MSDALVFESCGFTKISTVRFRYTWTINNFSFYCNTMGSKIASPTFSNQVNSSLISWHLEINPNGWYQDDKSDVSCMSLYLHLDSNSVSDFETNFKLSIVNGKSEEVYIFEDNKLFGQGKFHGNNSFIEKVKLLNEKAELYPKNKLTILCDITALTGSSNSSKKVKPLSIEHHVPPKEQLAIMPSTSSAMQPKSHVLSRDWLISQFEEDHGFIKNCPGLGLTDIFRLNEAGFDTCVQLLEKFLELEKNKNKFELWLKATCGTKMKNYSVCSGWLQYWCIENGLE